MKISKGLLLGALFSVAIAMPVLASESQSGLQDSLTDASLVFESNDAKPMQLAELSSQEMQETEGATHYHYSWHKHPMNLAWSNHWHQRWNHHSMLYGS